MDRKEEVKILGEHFGVKPKYLGTPSFSYQIETDDETYIIDREGKIVTATGEEVEFEELIEGSEDIGEDTEIEMGDSEEEPDKENSINLELVIPMEGHTGKTLRNLVNMIYSKQPLIKKALGLEKNMVDEDFITLINEAYIDSLESFKEALDGIDEGSLLGIDFDFQEETITFKNLENEAAIKLFALINKNAKAQKYASIKVKPTDNEKYTFRTWLLRLGMIGDEYKETRKELLQNLSGNSAFRKPKKEDLIHEA